MLRKVTKEEYDAGAALVPAHPNRVREERRGKATVYYARQYVFTLHGELAAMHDEDGGYWLSAELAERLKK